MLKRCAIVGMVVAMALRAGTGIIAQSLDGQRLTITLVTVGAGQDFFSWTGHSAIEVADAGSGRKMLFDYGVMHPGPANTRGLLTGTVLTFATLRDPDVKLAGWQGDGRTIRLQPLALTPQQRAALWLLLVADQQPGHSAYHYDFRLDNCTTRIRNLLDQVTGGALRRIGDGPAGGTVRTIGYRYLPRNWVVAGFDALLNDDVDQPLSRWDAALFPEQLSTLVADAVVTDTDGSQRALATIPAEREPLFHTTPVLFARSGAAMLGVGGLLGGFAALLGLFAAGGSRAARIALGSGVALLGSAFGLIGCVLAAGWFATQYRFATHNVNLALLNPVLLVAAPLGVAFAIGSGRAGARLIRLFEIVIFIGVMLAVGRSLHLVNQDASRTTLLIVPILVGVAVGIRLTNRGLRFPGHSPARDARPGRRNTIWRPRVHHATASP